MGKDAVSGQKVDFYGRDFKVSEAVLTPRAETEQVVDLVLALAGKAYLPGMIPPKRKLAKEPLILDIGTGSGCIGITLALEIPDAKVALTDISKEALVVAGQNLESFGLELPMVVSDLFQNISLEPTVAKSQKSPFYYGSTPGEVMKNGLFSKIGVSRPDLVVANLPYVDRNWAWVDQQALAGDPEISLYAGDGGLEVIKRLIEECRDRQIPRLVLEADPSQHQEIMEFAEEHYFEVERVMGFAIGLRRGS